MLEDLGNLGDFIGGIAVVITLIYLALQIKQNTASVRAAILQSASQAQADTLDMFVRDREALRIYQAGSRDFAGLSPDDRMRFASIMGAMLHRIEPLVAQTEQGLLPAHSWDGAANRIRGQFVLPGALEWWSRGKHVFNPQLQTWIEEEIIAKPLRPDPLSGTSGRRELD